MKLKTLFVFALVLLLSGINAQVNGELSQTSNKWILKTWGTHQQRGYAQGYLLSQPIMQIMNTYMYQTIAMNNPAVYNNLLDFYQTNFEVESKYQQEVQGMVDGLIASGTNVYMSGLQRNINSNDILMANCLVDLYFLQSQITGSSNVELDCASLSSWGTSTQADSILQGSVVISRFMDWNQDVALIANPLLLVSHPSEAGEQSWVSFTYPGMIGALSAISASGKAAFLNTGNIHNYNNVSGLHPILLSIRNGIELQDYNNDGNDNINDIFASISDEVSLAGSIVHAISENPVVMTGIIESNNIDGTVMRTVQNNDDMPPGMHLAATNTFRLLANPVCCTRYSNIVDSLTANPFVTAKRQLSLLSGAAGLQNNMMSMQYIPVSGRILWSTASLSQPAYECELSSFYLSTLLDFSSFSEDEIQFPAKHSLRVFPNPAHQNDQITIQSTTKTTEALEVFNLKGQKIAILTADKGGYEWNGRLDNGKAAGTGIYLIRMKGQGSKGNTNKLLLLP